MIFNGNAMNGLSRGGRGLGFLGQFASAFGAAPKWPIAGDIGFNEEWSYNDWKGNNGWTAHIAYWKLADYEPLSDTMVNRAQQAWSALKAAADLGNVAAENQLEQYKATFKGLASQVDANTKQFNALGQASDPTHRDRARLLTELNKQLKAFANAGVPAQALAPAGQVATTIPTQQGAVTTVLTGNVGTPNALSDQLTALISGLTSKSVATTPGAPPLVATTSGPSWVMPAAIGGGVLVFTGLVFALARKKKSAPAPAMAGYRRRRRRS